MIAQNLELATPGRRASNLVAFHISFQRGRLCWNAMRSEFVSATDGMFLEHTVTAAADAGSSDARRSLAGSAFPGGALSITNNSADQYDNPGY
jgi:hypothetical protein